MGLPPRQIQIRIRMGGRLAFQWVALGRHWDNPHPFHHRPDSVSELLNLCLEIPPFLLRHRILLVPSRVPALLSPLLRETFV